MTDPWLDGGWKLPHLPRTWDGRVLEAIELYDGMVARVQCRQARRRPPVVALKNTPTWKAFNRLLCALDDQGIDAEAYLTAQFSITWESTEHGCPYPNMLLSDAALNVYRRWNVDLARRYHQKAPAAAKEQAAITADRHYRLRRELEEGLYRYSRMKFKDIDRLVTVAPGTLPPAFFLAWPSIRQAVEEKRVGGEVAEAWLLLRQEGDAVRVIDEWAKLNLTEGRLKKSAV